MRRRKGSEASPDEVAYVRAVFRMVRAMRYSAGLSQKELGTLSKLSQSGLSYLENGHVLHTSLLTLFRVADAAGYEMVVSFIRRKGESE